MHTKEIETVRHAIADCPFAHHHRNPKHWYLIDKVKPQALETGMLDTHHGLNALEVKHWQALQQDAVHILHLRHIQLPDMEKRLGSPPSQRKLVCLLVIGSLVNSLLPRHVLPLRQGLPKG